MTAPRKALTRTEIILICQRQAQGPILCGCGCGEPIEPANEGVIDEHVLPRRLTEIGHEAERDVLENRSFWRKPCAKRKTEEDLARIAKARRQGQEVGQQARRKARGGSSIKGNRSIPSRPFPKDKSRGFDGKVRDRTGGG
jgi:hypothetical protein